MKMSSRLFLHFIFLGLFNSYFSLNPDSLVVESPEDNGEKNATIQTEDLDEKILGSLDQLGAQTRNPDSILTQTLLNNTEKNGKIGMPDNEQKTLTNYKSPCDKTREPDGGISIPNPVDRGRRMGKIRMGGNQEKMFISLDGPDALFVKYMTPAKVGPENLWTEVSSKRVNRTRDFTKRAGRIQMEDNEEKSFTSFDQLLVQTENPDSVMVQGPDDNGKTKEKMVTEDSEEKVFISFQRPDTFLIIHMRPVRGIGSEKVWREIHREVIDKTRNVTPFPDTRTNPRDRTMGPNPGDPYWTTERSITDGNGRTTLGNARRQTPRNTGNGNDNNNRENARTTSPIPTTKNEEDFSEDDKLKTVVTRPPGTISPDSNLFAGIVNDFAFKLVNALEVESNFVISPLSIFIALSMCYLGTDRQSKSQMEQVLGIDVKAIRDENFHQGIKDLLSSVMGGTYGYQLLVANGMFLAKKFEANPEFKENIRKFYDAELEKLDFGDPPRTLDFLNRWVSENTRNTITSISNSPPAVETQLMLLNAVYFKGTWKIQFPPQLTHIAKFHTVDGGDKHIEMMRMYDASFPIFKNDDLQHTFIKLPYEGDQLSMIIALPNTERAKPLSSITNKILCQMRAAMKDTTLGRVEIPKVHLEYTKSLTRALGDLGLWDIFDRNSVDLSKLRLNNDIFVSDIMHKAVVEVNEVGTTASGTTSDNFTPLIYRKNTNFVADHPFAFYIVHEPTGLVLFYGKVFDFDSVEGVPISKKPNGNGRPRYNSERRG